MERIALQRICFTVVPSSSGLKTQIKNFQLQSPSTPIRIASFSNGARGSSTSRENPVQIQLRSSVRAGPSLGRISSGSHRQQRERSVARSVSTGMSGEEVITESPSTNGVHGSSSNGAGVATEGKTDGNTDGKTGSKVYQFEAVGDKWTDIQGANDWSGLLDPLDPLLRSELIRYGQFCQATYDTFDDDANTKLAGSCRFAKNRMLEKSEIMNSGYEVTDYIYATEGAGTPKAIFNFVNKDYVNELGSDEVWSLETNWIGYVAVATDPEQIKRLGRRDIVVAWRGTQNKLEWIHDFEDFLVPGGLDPRREGQASQNLKIEKGFLSLYTTSDPNNKYIPSQTSARLQALNAVCRLVRKYGNDKAAPLSITVTGHSLGAALAVINGYDIAESSVNQPEHLPDAVQKWADLKPRANPNDVVELTEAPGVETVPVTVFTFAGPRVGNNAFKDRVNELKVKVLRVVNVNDLVPMAPGLLVNENAVWLQYLLKPVRNWIDMLPWTYVHVGEKIEIDNTASPFLVWTKNPFDVHNSEGYLHVLSGYKGDPDGVTFKPVVMRDLTLVNKSSALLLPKYFMPEEWWQFRYKGMIRVEKDGKWVTYMRETQDYPEDFNPSTMEAQALTKAEPDAKTTAMAAATPVKAKSSFLTGTQKISTA